MLKLAKEVELSPYVIALWQARGFCVHGEVSAQGHNVFIDHVAHTGPCDKPTYIVGIEMKRGISKSLRRQMGKLDMKHFFDEIWGVCISKPRDVTLKSWDKDGYYMSAGLMAWDAETSSLVILREPECLSTKYLKRNARKLLLVEENKGLYAGYPSGHEDNNYHTHWSLSRDHYIEWMSDKECFTTKDMNSDYPKSMEVYRKPAQMVTALLKMFEKEGRVKRAGKEGKYNKFKVVKEK